MRFDGRVAVVTGGASGIGRATAGLLAAEGAAVGILDRDAPLGREVAAEIATAGGRAAALEVDVRDGAAVASAVAELADRHGEADLLVTSAYRCGVDDLLGSDPQDWDDDVAVVLGGTVAACRAVLPGMVRQRRGSVVTIGSVNGSAAFGNDAYSAAKAGVLSLTRSIAVRHAGDGIRANCVVPATIRTPGWSSRVDKDPGLFDRLAAAYPLGRVGEAEDVARAIAFLLSDDAAWVTGTSLLVDGGLLAGSTTLVDLTSLDREQPGQSADSP